MSRYFGTKTLMSKYMDQVPMVGKGRISAVTMYYNKSSGCLRGMQLTYNHVSHPASFFTSVLLGSATSSSPNVVVKSLRLGLQEAIIKAEVYAPKCVQHVKLFTSKNNSVLVGKADLGAELYTPQRNRPDGMLVAIRGFQDKATYKGLDGIHRMLSVISPDSRQPCPLLTYPYKTLGQISAKATDGGFVCSGGLIGEDRVLTAGHCVWDDRGSQGPFQDLSFSPAQWKKDGKITAPLGQVDWDYVTLFEAYVNDPDGEGLAYDISVITLKRAVGRTLGFLGIRADTSPCKSTALNLTLAGYPGDDPEYPIPGGWQGGCFYDTCTVNFSCAVSITNHTCDSYVGQSGAPMYDRDNYIRAVHTLGVLPGFSTSNGAITIQKFILDNVMGYWKDTAGFAPAPPGSIGSGMYF
ncbi:hypothetical protein OEZ86_014253 [Tetradesmus obliquus]|nr:hypothetical protein OEZ86_014253 [Tetradesmus obliquus]